MFRSRFFWQLYGGYIVIVLVFALVVGFAFASTELLGLRIAGSEILSRTAPTLIDLGVALAAGGAAAFAYTRRNVAAALAGVAIAVRSSHRSRSRASVSPW